MLSDNQKQDASSGSVALQAGRDAVLNVGMSFKDVKDICLHLFEENFPKLKQAAAEAAKQNASEFIDVLSKQLFSPDRNVDFEKLSDPDVLASLNNALLESGKRGRKIDFEILSELIIERTNKGISDILELTAREALTAVPRMTKTQINFLSFVHYVTAVTVRNDLRAIEMAAVRTQNLVSDGIDLSYANILHLQYLGILTYNTMLGTDVFGNRLQSDSHLGVQDLDAYKALIQSQAPTYHKLIDEFDKKYHGSITLTPVGKLIGLVNLTRVLGKMDYKIWIS